jgi:hypothetical protein
MEIVDTYLSGLHQALPNETLQELLLAEGASAEALQTLTERYPLCPSSLLDMLGKIDGTHFREYPQGEVVVLMLGSDVFEYPYFLRSVEQILEDANAHTGSIAQIYGDYLQEEPETVGPGIDISVCLSKRLCFSHCMNNGGSSMLYIDFDPALGGTVGQIVRFLHDPDSYEVIAESFDLYLRQLIDGGYSFICEDE